jgi:transposase
MQAIIHAADIQDRDGGVLLMGALFGLYPFLLKLYADSGYQGAKFQAGLHAVCGQINLEVVKRSDRHKFVVLPKRWIVERTIAWLNRCRRLAKDWECLNRTGLAFLRWASVRLMGTAARLGVRGRKGHLQARFPIEAEATWSGS